MKIVQKDTIVQIVVDFNIFHDTIAMLFECISFWIKFMFCILKKTITILYFCSIQLV